MTASVYDPCPWHPDTLPSATCELIGHRDDPRVVVKVFCPVCRTTKNYFPSDAEVQDHYENRYSHNLRLIKAVASKLATAWNWKYKHHAGG